MDAGTAIRPGNLMMEQRVAEKNLKDLFLHTLKDVYFAEHEILKALPELAAAAQTDKLKQAFATHQTQTEQQVQRLKEVFDILGQKAEGVPCEAIRGILEEGREVLQEFAGGPALDAGLIAAAQAVEHYEIARYGALRSWAELIGLDEVEALLDQTLTEEKATDALLTQLAEGMVNVESA
jgi:ferritin-like metal-binding protein YciE